MSHRAGCEGCCSFSGRAFLGNGFRPLFLAAGLWAATVVPLWIAVWEGMVDFPGPGSPSLWHVHEMVFGYVGAALGGFLLTAVPTWTDRPPVRGAPLGALALAWLAGRAVVWWGGELGFVATAGIDLAYLAALSVLVGRDIVAARNWRNLPVLASLVLLLAANVLFHLAAADIADTGSEGMRLAVAAIVMMLSVIGGRIVPSFTRNWLPEPDRPKIAMPTGRFDRAALVLTAIALAAWVVSAPAQVTGSVLIAAGATNAIRLVRWRGWLTLGEPLVAVLHLGYLWLVAGLVLLGVSMLGGQVTAALALHVLTIGAMGTMTLAVMTRAVLGHTGRELRAGPGTVAIYGLATASVLARCAFEIAPDAVPIWVTACFWFLAFAVFLALYAPMLFLPRQA